MKIVTSIGLFNDAVGKRISITYSEVNDSGQIVSDNQRIDRVVTDSKASDHANAIAEYAQRIIEEE